MCWHDIKFVKSYFLKKTYHLIKQNHLRPCLHVTFWARFCQRHIWILLHFVPSCVNNKECTQTILKTVRKTVQKTLRVNQALIITCKVFNIETKRQILWKKVAYSPHENRKQECLPALCQAPCNLTLTLLELGWKLSVFDKVKMAKKVSRLPKITHTFILNQTFNSII